MRLLGYSPIRVASCLLWCLCWPIIAMLLLRPMPFDLPSRSDLLSHFLLFGTMAVVVILFARSRLQILALSTLTIILSLVLEAAQGYVPHRYADVADALANMTGAVAGGVLALLIFRHLSASASHAARA